MFHSGKGDPERRDRRARLQDWLEFRHAMLRRFLLIAAIGIWADRAMAEEPSSFYIISHFDSDLEGAWNYHILEVGPAGSGSLVRYILIAPVRLCPRRLTVRAAEAR